jgi:CheY-like chemotaxis protein
VIRLLFVDDELRVLDAIRRAARRWMLTGEWQAEWVTSGAEAVDRLACTPFDVIVTDMRMPEMDGARLLEEVQQRYPQIVRVVLTGQSEMELTIRAIGTCHWYLRACCTNPWTLRDSSV